MDSNNYVVGRGKLYFNRFVGSTLVGEGFRYFGNTPALSTSESAQSLDHYSSDEGMKFKDRSVDISNDMSGAFTCDNIDVDNLALWFLGSVSPQTISSIDAVHASIVGTFSGTGTAADTITINGVVVTLESSAATGSQINVGVSATATAQNLKTLINNNPSEFGVTAAGAGAALTLTAIAGGTVGNSIALSEASTEFSWAGAATTLAGGSDGVVETLTGVQQGLYYPLGVSDDTPQGLRGVTVTEVTNATTPVTGDNNFTYDPITGLFAVTEGAPDIDNGDDLDVSFSVAGGTRDMVIGSNQSVYGALRFYSTNAEGRQKDYFWPYVKCSADGDMNLKGDDWQVVGWKFDVLKMDGVERVYIDDRG